jgi:hypothetical protein
MSEKQTSEEMAKEEREKKRKWNLSHRERNREKYREYARKARERMMEYEPWKRKLSDAKQRCRYFKLYVKQGIKCFLTLDEIKEIWFRDKAFSLNRPSLDRIDSKGDYVFDNCRFIELAENQGRSKEKQSYCKQGHPFAIHGFITNLGYRECKLCLNIRKAKYRKETKDLLKSKGEAK